MSSINMATIGCVVFALFACSASSATEPAKELGISMSMVRNDKDCAIPTRRKDLPQCDWHYIAYFPRIFRSGIAGNVAFSTQGFPNKVKLVIKVVAAKGGKVFTEVEREVQPDVLTTIPVSIAHDAPSNVKVSLTGYGQYTTDKHWSFANESQSISVEKMGLNILIQTDRPIYKPGQQIRSRVIVIDSELKPFKGTLDSLIIENPTGSIMRMWKDTQLEEGFASFDLKTSIKPVLGSWKIKAKTKNYQKTLEIKVDKYVLPKFQVSVKPPPFVTMMMESTSAEICAKYSYGKNVIGKMNATVCLERSSRYSWRKMIGPKSQCMIVHEKIDGCTTLNVDLEEMKKKFPPAGTRWWRPQYYLKVNATVKETATSVMLSSKVNSQTLTRKDVELSVEAKKVFKPGFEHQVKLLAKRPDQSPIPKVKVTLKATCNDASTNKQMTLIDQKVVTIENGVKEITLPEIPFSAKNCRVSIEYMREQKLYEGESTYQRKSSGNIYLSPWYSPSHSYLSVKQVKPFVEIGSDLDVVVGYTAVDPMPLERKISTSLMCGGNLVASNSFAKTFIGAVAGYTTPTPETTAPPPPILIPSKTNLKVSTHTQKKIYGPYPWWYGGPSATRPPLPADYSRGEFKFSIKITKDMLPSCRLLVYYVRNEEVVADETKFIVLNQFENQVTMKFDKKEVRPGNKVKLTVKGASQSRIAVAAVDKSIHFLADGNDIKTKELVDIREKLTISPGYVSDFNRCPGGGYGRYWGGGSSDFVDSQKAFANIGAIVLTSMRVDPRPCEDRPIIMFKTSVADRVEEAVPEAMAKPSVPKAKGRPGPKEKSKPAKKKKKAVRERTEFPETWLWTDERLPENGMRVFDVQVPDSITNWYASGFGVSPTAGLGVANPTELRVFQPFFISLALPYSVIRDEDVTIPAAVFSYLEGSCMAVRIEIALSKDYQMATGRSAKTCLCSGRTATVLFRIKPNQLGRINVRVNAETLDDSDVCSGATSFSEREFGDIVVRKLLVEPEGTKDEYTQSTFFCTKDAQHSNNLDLVLPENLVPGSLYSNVEVIGDVMGSSLSNVDDLLAMPYGCGEQNMLKFAPNIFIMNYLKNSNQVNEEIKTKALDYMRSGYQRELTYKHSGVNNGAYSAFGNRDKEGSTWLTAFVLKSYAQAQPWIDVDQKEIKVTRDWLIRNQGRDGCFPKIGQLHHKAMSGGVKTPATLSAYVIISLLEAGSSANSATITSGAKCVQTVFEEMKRYPEQKADTYSLSIMAYMFAKLGYKDKYDSAVNLLDQMATEKDGMVHWSEKKEKEDSKKLLSYWYKPRSADIEQTAYVLLAKLTMGGAKVIGDVIPIVQWLSKSRNSRGGWSSTQDTVLAMQALAEFAGLTYSSDTNMEVNIRAGSNFDHKFDIEPDNKMVLQRAENFEVPSKVSINAKGKGCALVQANVKYNVKKVFLEPKFKIHVKIVSADEKLTLRTSCRSQTLKVCTSWLGEEDESNMAIIDVRMVSGFTADEEQFKEILKGASTMDLKDIEVKEKSLIFYLRKIGKSSQCVKFKVDQTTDVKDAKDAPIQVYDYYDKEQTATVMYTFTKKHCCGDDNKKHAACQSRLRRSVPKPFVV